MSDWTFVTFKEYLDTRLDATCGALDQSIRAESTARAAALAAQKEAVIKAENANEKRFESVNEFRAQLGAQQATYVTLVEFQAEIRALRAANAETVAGLTGRYEATITGLTTSLNELKERLTRNEARYEGKTTGQKDTIGWIFGAAGFVAALLAILFRFIG